MTVRATTNDSHELIAELPLKAAQIDEVLWEIRAPHNLYDVHNRHLNREFLDEDTYAIFPFTTLGINIFFKAQGEALYVESTKRRVEVLPEDAATGDVLETFTEVRYSPRFTNAAPQAKISTGNGEYSTTISIARSPDEIRELRFNSYGVGSFQTLAGRFYEKYYIKIISMVDSLSGEELVPVYGITPFSYEFEILSPESCEQTSLDSHEKDTNATAQFVPLKEEEKCFVQITLADGNHGQGISQVYEIDFKRD